MGRDDYFNNDNDFVFLEIRIVIQLYIHTLILDFGV